jgi:hypothetical protein
MPALFCLPIRWWRPGRTSGASALIVRQRGGGSGLVQQIDVTVLLGAGETAVDRSRLVVLYRIRHVASADHASALTAVQVGRVSQTALTTLWPSVEAEEVPARHDQLHGAHAPKIIQTLLVWASSPKPLDRARPGAARPGQGTARGKPSRERENPPKRFPQEVGEEIGH